MQENPSYCYEQKTMASARAKVNLMKGSKKNNNVNQNDESYLGDSLATGSNHVTIQTDTRTSGSQLHTGQRDSQILTLDT